MGPTIALVVSAALGLVLILALLSRSQHQKANYTLSICIACAFWAQFATYWFLYGTISKNLINNTIFPVLILSMIGFYVYVLQLTRRSFSYKMLSRHHILLLVCTFVWFVGVECFELLSQRISPEWRVWENFLRLVVFTFLKTAYLVAMIKEIRNYEKNIPNIRSNIDFVALQWLKLIIAIHFGAWIVLNIDVLTGPNIRLDHVRLYFFPASAFILAFFALRHSMTIYPVEYKITLPAKEPPKGTLLNDAELKSLSDRLLAYLQTDKPFLNPELDLRTLADVLNITPNQLSEVINRGLSENFYGLINRYRIEEFKSRLLNPTYKHLNLVGLAFDCGFNSKSTFNSTFKKYVGVTPSQFRVSGPN